jgi:hypothetical protein
MALNYEMVMFQVDSWDAVEYTKLLVKQTMNVTVFYDVKSCSLLYGYHPYSGIAKEQQVPRRRC